MAVARTLVGPAADSLAKVLGFGLGTSVLAWLIYGGYGLLFSMRGVRALYDSFARAADAAFGTIFGALGLSLLLRGD